MGLFGSYIAEGWKSFVCFDLDLCYICCGEVKLQYVRKLLHSVANCHVKDCK